MELLIFIFGVIYLAVRDLVDVHNEGKKYDDIYNRTKGRAE